MNNMVYNRGDVRRDYDWETMYGAKGWNFRDMLKYFVKSEDNHDAIVLTSNRCYHGQAQTRALAEGLGPNIFTQPSPPEPPEGSAT